MYFYTMKNKYFELTYIFFLSIIGFINFEGIIDMIGSQWFYLSLINIFGIVYIFTKKFLLKDFSINSFFKNPQNIFYLCFFITCLFSLFNSINISVSLVALSKTGTILLTIFILSQLDFKPKIDFNLFYFLFTALLLIEVIMSLQGYVDIIKQTDFQFSMAGDYMRGITGNKNIASASIAFKIPFAYLLFYSNKNILIKIISILIITVSFFNLYLLSSRAIIVSYSLSLIFITIGYAILYSKAKHKKNIYALKKIFVLLLPIIISYFYFQKNINDDNLSIENRISSINTEDVSANTRIRYYKKGINYFLSNPLIGSGIGNWQIVSIDLDSENIESYVVPYVAHNDFIEVLVESGFFGGLFYLLFILFTLYILIKTFFKTSSLEHKEKILFLSIPFIIYFIDANLNFPQYRPIMQVGFILYSFLVINLKTKNQKNV